MLPSCQPETPEPPEAGVPIELARDRAARLDSVRYALHFDLPAGKSDSILAHLELNFTLSEADRPLALDFTGPPSAVHSVRIGAEEIEAAVDEQHILLPARRLRKGRNQVYIEFTAGDQSLNRSEEYLYTLLVPDRARTLFPCFDQPDIKARYQLSLNIPEEWVAVANGAVEGVQTLANGKQQYRFRETLPISSYLFAFAAGRFRTLTQERSGRSMTMYHRETDSAKVVRNADIIFDLHDQAIRWLEEYTDIPLPFSKFDFALIPGFQYGGMEHVGNIFYRASSLMLDESATDNQKLGRTRLIAHETAHMWFGDLVTMKWFNDVWLKEVFANFMAAKAVNPSFPDINHDLSFLLSHHPSAYAEDRSGGSHPIQQQLENLKDAGTLYGRIIYQKAPVVMRQLEQLTGPDAFRDGLREYLHTFAYGNATWDDLIAILDRQTDLDLKGWSDVWVKEAEMPVLRYEVNKREGRIDELALVQEKTAPNGNYWTQYTEVALLYKDSIRRLPVSISGEKTVLPEARNLPLPLATISNAAEMAYGYFKLDAAGRDYLLVNLTNLEDPLLRGAGWIALNEGAIRGDIGITRLMKAVQNALMVEREPLNRQFLISIFSNLYWKFLQPAERIARAPEYEEMLWKLAQEAEDVGAKAAYFRTFRHFTLTPEGIRRLYDIWDGNSELPNLPLSESDRIALAEALALRLPERAEDILDRQLESIENPDRRRRFQYIRPALSPDPTVRDSFFSSLKDPANREVEPWVVDAVEYLHHPLRTEQSIQYILPSLELMEEIQITGDIFFPRQWIGATLGGHQSPEAAAIVRQFLEERPDYPYRLKNKILMAADLLFRCSEREAMDQ